MAIKNIIGMGIGFSPGSVKFIPTLGFTVGAASLVVPDPYRPRAAESTGTRSRAADSADVRHRAADSVHTRAGRTEEAQV